MLTGGGRGGLLGDAPKEESESPAASDEELDVSADEPLSPSPSDDVRDRVRLRGVGVVPAGGTGDANNAADAVALACCRDSAACSRLWS